MKSSKKMILYFGHTPALSANANFFYALSTSNVWSSRAEVAGGQPCPWCSTLAAWYYKISVSLLIKVPLAINGCRADRVRHSVPNRQWLPL